jgi:ankyrin repeat protein
VKRFILAIFCIVAVAVPILTQGEQGKLANLIQAGNRKAALDMIRSGADVNEAQPDGTRPIHWAVYRVDYEVMEVLLAKKAKADVRNELGSTPLAEAVKLSESRLVKMLLDAGSGPEGANDDGQTALMIALKNADLPIVEMLVAAGANVNAVEKVQNQTPLMWAAAATRNAPEMVKLLISKGAKVNARAKYTDWPSQITSEPRAQYHAYGGLTVLLYAARGGCYACVEALVGAGADVNLPTPEGVTPLMIALDNNNNDVAKFLMDHGANPHVWDVYGRTALYIAVDKKAAPAGGTGGGGAGGGGRGGGAGGRGAAAAAPAAPAGEAAAAGRGAGQGAAGQGAGGRGAGGRGGGQGAPGGFGGGVPALRAGGGPVVSSMDVINALLTAGVDPNPQLNMRRPSNQGGRFNDPLLSTGTTPLLRALVNNDVEVARVLLDKGANPNIYGMGATPFLLAAGANPYPARGGGGAAAVNTELLDLMIQKGADVNSQVTGVATYSMRIARSPSDGEGMSALHYAVQAGRTDLVRYLLNHGARTDLVDGSGRTPLDVLNGAPARRAATNADASGLAPINPTIPAGVRGSNAPAGRGGNAATTQEIRTLLQNAAQNQQK